MAVPFSPHLKPFYQLLIIHKQRGEMGMGMRLKENRKIGSENKKGNLEMRNK